MGPRTRSLLYCLLFLTVAEVAVRVLDARTTPTVTVAGERPLVFLLGSSRTRRGLRPRTMMEELEANGVAGAHVWNLARPGVKNVGLHEVYSRDVRPRVDATATSIVVMIELRASAANDSATTRMERDYVRRAALPPLDVPPATLGSAGDTSGGDSNEASSNPPFDLASWARVLLGSIRLTQISDIVERSSKEEAESGKAVAEGEGEALPSFGLGEELGWRPFTDRKEDKNVEYARRRYEGELLVDYRLGGVQTEYLVRLVREVRTQGGIPVLYILPVLDVHRTFGKGDEFQRFHDHAHAIASAEDVTLIDLDTDHDLPASAFRDTHHLHESGAELVSRELGEALADLLLGERVGD